MKITITGTPGSGKSTIAKMLAKQFDLRFYSIGDLMDKIAMEKRVSLSELSKLAETDDTIDRKLDAEQIKLRKKNDFILDSRLGWHFIPDSIKIFLDVNLDEATKRIFSDERAHEKENTSLEITKENIIKRIQSEKLRYNKYYDIDFYNPDIYDIFIDTSNLSQEEVFNNILSLIKKLKK